MRKSFYAQFHFAWIANNVVLFRIVWLNNSKNESPTRISMHGTNASPKSICRQNGITQINSDIENRAIRLNWMHAISEIIRIFPGIYWKLTKANEHNRISVLIRRRTIVYMQKNPVYCVHIVCEWNWPNHCKSTAIKSDLLDILELVRI